MNTQKKTDSLKWSPDLLSSCKFYDKIYIDSSENQGQVKLFYFQLFGYILVIWTKIRVEFYKVNTDTQTQKLLFAVKSNILSSYV